MPIKKPIEFKEVVKRLLETSAAPETRAFSDDASYEEAQETLSLLKILALGNSQVDKDEVTPVGEVVDRLRSEARRD